MQCKRVILQKERIRLYAQATARRLAKIAGLASAAAGRFADAADEAVAAVQAKAKESRDRVMREKEAARRQLEDLETGLEVERAKDRLRLQKQRKAEAVVRRAQEIKHAKEEEHRVAIARLQDRRLQVVE